jgi:hypothetical protein
LSRAIAINIYIDHNSDDFSRWADEYLQQKPKLIIFIPINWVSGIDGT